MRKFLLGIIVALLVVVAFNTFDTKEKTVITENSKLIKEQIKKVGKLVVTEGYFSEVFNYKNSKEIIANFTSDKTALVVANAKVTAAYNLEEISFDIDEKTKTLLITNIPEVEINIYPELEYYDINSGVFNPFEAKDYNQIQQSIKASILKKVEASSLKANANDRLLSELSKFYILTQSMGWYLKYNGKLIDNKVDVFVKP